VNSLERATESINGDGKLRVHKEAGARLSGVMGKGKGEAWAPVTLFISHIAILSRPEATDSLTHPSSASRWSSTTAALETPFVLSRQLR